MRMWHLHHQACTHRMPSVEDAYAVYENVASPLLYQACTHRMPPSFGPEGLRRALNVAHRVRAKPAEDLVDVDVAPHERGSCGVPVCVCVCVCV
jgi:hypothetical protein